MWKKTGARWLVLSFLVCCVHTQDAPTTAKPASAAPAATTAKPASAAPAATTAKPASTTAKPAPATPAATTAKPASTTAKPAFTTAKPASAAPAAPAATTAAPAKSTTPVPTKGPTAAPTSNTGAAIIQPPPAATTAKTPVPALATQKTSTPFGITTVSKVQTAAMTPKGGAGSPPQAKTTPLGSAPPVPPVHTTRLTQTTAPKGPSQTPNTRPPVITQSQGTGPTVTLAKQTVVITTKKDDKGVAGATTAVAFKTSPGQNRGSTASPAPLTPTKAPTPDPRGKTGPEAQPSTPESRVQTITQTMPPTVTTAPAPALRKTFSYSLNNGLQPGEEEKELVATCRQLMMSFEDGNCTLTFVDSSTGRQFVSGEVLGKVKNSIMKQVFDDFAKKPSDNRTLITILASCGALLLMIVILAVCASHHRKPYSETQRPLTDELQAVENGYHDNPTLEVMEVQGAEPEKKAPLSLNGEFNDGWIVPMENLLREDGPDEEDTHL